MTVVTVCECMGLSGGHGEYEEYIPLRNTISIFVTSTQSRFYNLVGLTSQTLYTGCEVRFWACYQNGLVTNW